MTNRSATPATFVIERDYAAAPEKVFALWTNKEQKLRWFGMPDDPNYSLDFKVGGEEHSKGGPPEGPVYSYDVVYRDIVPNERIVYHYTMDAGDDRISVSVTTVEFVAGGSGTKLTYTEQGVFLDGHDNPAARQEGTELLLNALGAAL
ncbi:MAG TPA: SRPBCC family protein [Acidimicrobiales bacterium]